MATIQETLELMLDNQRMLTELLEAQDHDIKATQVMLLHLKFEPEYNSHFETEHDAQIGYDLYNMALRRPRKPIPPPRKPREPMELSQPKTTFTGGVQL